MAVQDEMIETDEDSDDAECDLDEDSDDAECDPDEDDNGCNFTTIRDETEAARQWREQLEADTRTAEEVRQ